MQLGALQPAAPCQHGNWTIVSDRSIVKWPVGSRVRIGAGHLDAEVVEVISTYRVKLPDGRWMVVEEGQIKDGIRP